MGKEKVSMSSPSNLRNRAEKRLSHEINVAEPTHSGFELERLIHELQVHQAELEIQNEELLRERADREEMEAQLGRYSDLYDFAPAGYFNLDKAGIIRAVNFTGASLLGVERSLLLGRRMETFISHESIPLFLDLLDRIFASSAKESCEIEFIKGGRPARFAQVEAMVSESGEDCRAVVLDITDRRRAEAEIRRLATFPQMYPHPILEVAENGRMTFFNRAMEQVLEDVDFNEGSYPFIPKDLGTVFQRLRENDAGPIRREIELNGRCFEELLFLTPQFQTLRIYTMDITERKEDEGEIKRLNASLSARSAELETTNKELDAFNYMVSHDLLNHLNAVSLNCQLLQQVCKDVDCHDYIDGAYNSVLKMEDFVNSMLEFSRLSHGELDRRDFDLSALALEVALCLKQVHPERRIDLRIEEGIQANGNRKLLRVVLENLFGNAFKYTGKRDKTVIAFGVKKRDGEKVYFLSDNGEGFDLAECGRLFIPFQRLSGSNEFRGSGIGLATVERIVRRHGGGVWAESEPGKGATFCFTLGNHAG